MAAREYNRLKKKYDEISEILQCPVCLDFAIPPVKQCINGHICCFSCGNFLINCPMCRDRFAHRNTLSLVNYIVGLFIRPCPFRGNGCLATLKPAEYEGHIRACLRRKVLCKICYRKVSAKCLRFHLTTYHKEQTWLCERNVVVFENFNFRQNSQFTEIINAFEELFWFCFSFNSADRTFNCAVQYIGPKRGAKRYMYEIDSDPHNTSDDRILFKRTTHHYLDSVRYTFHNDGISLKQGLINSLAQDREFMLHLTMYKKNEEPIEEATVSVLLSGS